MVRGKHRVMRRKDSEDDGGEGRDEELRQDEEDVVASVGGESQLSVQSADDRAAHPRMTPV